MDSAKEQMERETEALLPSMTKQLDSNFSQLQSVIGDHPELKEGEYYKKAVEFISANSELIGSLLQ